MIEVKSDYLFERDEEEIEKKRNAVLKEGYLYDIYVINEKKKIVMIV